MKSRTAVFQTRKAAAPRAGGGGRRWVGGWVGGEAGAGVGLGSRGMLWQPIAPTTPPHSRRECWPLDPAEAPVDWMFSAS